ncbi:MAG: hypothetical protein HYZ36_04805 [Pedosphaera parvula]|nr:hypothetical protein [Pedosphaera parvula]
MNRHLDGADWLDWSTEAAAAELVQASLMSTPLSSVGGRPAILLAGPVVELLEPAQLFTFAADHLKAGGKLVGILPCLRDNAPENQQFRDLAAAELWPYYTVEELTETAEETGLQADRTASAFVPVRQFNESVLNDQLVFKGFRRLFDQLEAQGYDPAVVGWGELRLVAALNQSPSSS